jgi:2-C-methyl-D-erythritol 2,4-cyclodiphosphate synthase
MRIGHGYDCHRFSNEGHEIIIGGVRIPFDRGIVAHSDGDVLIHALIDALLGAQALGDIGHYFPDTDPKYQDIASQVMLETVVAMTYKHYRIVNIDSTVIAEKPKLAPYLQQMRQYLSEILVISSNQINIKATTHEKMGPLGRSEGLAAHVVVLLEEL